MLSRANCATDSAGSRMLSGCAKNIRRRSPTTPSLTEISTSSPKANPGVDVALKTACANGCPPDSNCSCATSCAEVSARTSANSGGEVAGVHMPPTGSSVVRSTITTMSIGQCSPFQTDSSLLCDSSARMPRYRDVALAIPANSGA